MKSTIWKRFGSNTNGIDHGFYYNSGYRSYSESTARKMKQH